MSLTLEFDAMQNWESADTGVPSSFALPYPLVSTTQSSPDFCTTAIPNPPGEFHSDRIPFTKSSVCWSNHVSDELAGSLDCENGTSHPMMREVKLRKGIKVASERFILEVQGLA